MKSNKTLLLGALLLLLGISLSSANLIENLIKRYRHLDATCPAVFSGFDGTTKYFLAPLGSRDQAKAYCLANGGKLADMTNQDFTHWQSNSNMQQVTWISSYYGNDYGGSCLQWYPGGAIGTSATGCSGPAKGLCRVVTSCGDGNNGGGGYDYWPNPTSFKNSDPWLSQNHLSIKKVMPKVLVLNFDNPDLYRESPNTNADLVQRSVNAFREGSKFHGQGDPQYDPQVIIRNLRNGDPAVGPAPEGWNRAYSTALPVDQNNFVNYAGFYSQAFAQYLGFMDPNTNQYMDLCTIVNEGLINEVWFLMDGAEGAYETGELKQMYDINNNKIEGQFTYCGGNGCLPSDVPWCGRSLRIAFMSTVRGPSCFMHNFGHTQEWATFVSQAVPQWLKWFADFAQFNLNVRYPNFPFSDFYGACAYNFNCLQYNNDGSLTVHAQNGIDYVLPNWDPKCGNTHFPPNAQSHYDYFNTAITWPTSCQNFGTPNANVLTNVNANTWAPLEIDNDNCGGGFLVWWAQQMPWHGSGLKFQDGSVMYSPGPFFFY